MNALSPASPLVVDDPTNPPQGVIPFGKIHVGTSQEQVIGMPVSGLSTHMYVCGTGSGKSTLTEHFIFGLAKSGKSMVLIDPHGTLVDNALKYLLHYAPERAKDCLVLDFDDPERPVSFNPLAVTSHDEIEGVVSCIREATMRILNLEIAPPAIRYLEQVLWALAEANLHAFHNHRAQALNLLMVPTFLTEKPFRELVMQSCTNMSVLAIFGPEGSFNRLGEREQLDHVMPILRTFAALSVKDSFANIFGQSESKIDFATWIRERKIVMIKLPSKASDAAVATFIGAMVTPMSIASLPAWGTDPATSCHLFIDEFQNYATESFRSLLAQTRRYGLHGIAINQIPQDLPADVLHDVLCLTQTKIAMQLDARLVKDVADSIASGNTYPRPDDIASLKNFWGWANVMLGDGTSSGPFMFKGMPPIYERGFLDDETWKRGNENYQRLLPEVEESSRLASAEHRDTVIAKRQNHMRTAMTIMERAR